VTLKTFPGPPNYEDVHGGDRPETEWIITPPADAPGWLGKVQDYELIVLDPRREAALKIKLGQYVTVEGTVEMATTGHHHTPYVIRAQQVVFSPKESGLISRNPQKNFIIENMARLAKEQGHADVNHFYAVRLATTDWVYWREGRRLLPTSLEPYWESKGATEIRARAVWRLRFVGKSIDLENGVVPSDADRPSGTTFIVSEQYVAGLIYECVVNGEMVELTGATSRIVD
jgi:hypothetical protein